MVRKENKIWHPIAVVETLIFFVILFLIAAIFSLPFNFFKVCPHPFWIIVILISCQYGTVEGVFAAIVATLIFLLGPLPVREVLDDRSDYFFVVAKTPILWFVTAVILGELRMKHIRERNELKIAAIEAEEKEKKVANAYNSLKKIKERLEIRVASDIQTALMVVGAFKKIEETGREGTVKGASELIKILVAPEQFSIFLLNNQGELRCAASNGWEEKDHYQRHFSPSSQLYQEVIINKRIISIYTNDTETLGSEGLAAAPIIDEESQVVYGMIKIEQIPFLRLRTTALGALKIIGEWVGSSYAKFSEDETSS